ncbi:MAG TPA: hypothetical protein VNI54_10590 [Thermoanaerobaculia bacterium]|nr:hypothetical protein [Thermoanaerobaculia bacterium]
MIRKIVLLLLLATPLAAQETEFFIERIEVRNHRRVSPHVVVAESRLREGQSVSEEELRDASARLTRLPFLLSVDFALERGTERGKHVLVITLQETKPFFFLLDVQQYFDTQSRYVEADDDSRGATGENLALGFRWFVGRRGAVHIGFSGIDRDREFSREYASLAAGYTQYDIFGTRAFATVNLTMPVQDSSRAQLSPQVVVGVPLSANQTLTLKYDEARFEQEILDYDSGYEQRIVTARWTHNTTNEPFFPTRGTLLYAGPVLGWTDGASTYTIVGPDGTDVRTQSYHSRFYGIETGAAKYVELTDRDSVWGDVRLETSRAEIRDSFDDNDADRVSNYGSAGIGYSHSLWSLEERAGGGDSRLEVTARYANRTRRHYPEFPERQAPALDTRQVGGAWLRRTSWGTLRLGVGYAW